MLLHEVSVVNDLYISLLSRLQETSQAHVLGFIGLLKYKLNFIFFYPPRLEFIDCL